MSFGAFGTPIVAVWHDGSALPVAIVVVTAAAPNSSPCGALRQSSGTRSTSGPGETSRRSHCAARRFCVAVCGLAGAQEASRSVFDRSNFGPRAKVKPLAIRAVGARNNAALAHEPAYRCSGWATKAADAGLIAQKPVPAIKRRKPAVNQAVRN
jgi:hypothetical protein